MFRPSGDSILAVGVYVGGYEWRVRVCICPVIDWKLEAVIYLAIYA